MFIIANFLAAIAEVLKIVFNILNLLILMRALVSWVNPDPNNPLVQFLYKTTEWLLYPIRKRLPFALQFGIDISPLVALLIILFLRVFLVSTLSELATRIKFS